MSVPPVTVDAPVPASGSRRKRDREAQSLFDLIHSRQLLARVPHEAAQGMNRLPANRVNEASNPALKAAPSAPVAQPSGLERRSSPGPVDTHLEPAHRDSHRDGSFTSHGTLPVIVMGQLVELTLLRERRAARDAEPVRRLTMRLDGGPAGSVDIDARVQDEQLVIRFTSGVPADAAAQARYAEEVRALASRLSWQFAATTWESVA